MPKNLKYYVFTFIFIFVLLASCTMQQETAEATVIQFEDALGRSVELSKQPERIVIGGNGALMIVDALLSFSEGQERLVAYTKTNQGKGSFTETLLTDSSAETIEDRTSVEAIASYQPEVVLLKTYMKELGNTLEELDIPVVYLNLETYEQYQQDMRNLGLILGNTERAEELLNYYDGIISDVTAKTEILNDNDKPTVLFAYYDTKDGAVALNVPPMEWAQTISIQRAGGIPVWSDIQLGSKWTVISFEQIAAWNPDVVLLTSYFEDIDSVKEILLADPQWQQLEAVKNGHIYAYPMAFYSWDQPHTRWGITQQWTAYVLHPELFADFNFQQESIDFYNLFYGWDKTKFDDIILSRLQGDIP